MARIVLLQDLDSRVLLAGMIVDSELTEEEKKELVTDGKAAVWQDEEPKKKVKHGKNKYKAS